MGSRGKTFRIASILLGALSACGPAAPTPSPADAWIEYAGCRAVTRDLVCEVASDRTLRLWVPDAPDDRGQPKLRLRDARGDCSLRVLRTVESGTLYALEVSPEAEWIEITDQNAARPRSFRLVLASAAPTPTLDEVRRLRSAGQSTQAEALIARKLASLPEPQRNRASAILARIEIATGRLAQGLPRLRQSLEQARLAGRLSETVEDAAALAFFLTVHELRYAEARAVLDGVRPLANAYPEGRVIVGYYQALVRSRSGDRRGALRGFEATLKGARRLGLAEREAAAQQELAAELAFIGRTDEAVAMQAALVAAGPPSRSPCTSVRQRLNLAHYAALNRMQSLRGGRVVEAHDPGSLLTAARAALAGCDDVYVAQMVLVNEAQYSIARGDIQGATRALGQLERANGPRLANALLWHAELSASIAMLKQQPRKALELFLKQQELAAAKGDPDGRFRAQIGRVERGGRWDDPNRPRRASRKRKRCWKQTSRASRWDRAVTR